ncbi:MAG: MurR/RpiR family transcriptional regulator [Erysipelotrichaceae bacterium]|nr:MurR/RpiR family transcriptional regulator [Erysipelotrichaceae bacterium]MDY5251140.1 MurR/RpiR family transcriptional regulator [Erysipelotrichaceae bacterium]
MNPIELIQNHFEDFTKNEKEIAIYIINNPHQIFHYSIMDLVKNTKTSKSAIIRFTQKLGYEGFSDFKFDLRRAIISNDNEYIENNSIIRSYIECLVQMEATMDKKQISNLAEQIVKSNRIKVVGSGRTFNSAFQLKQRLLKIGIDSEAIQEYSIIRDSLSILKQEDLVIIFTIADNGKAYTPIFKDFDFDFSLNTITMTNNLPFKKFCNNYITLPKISNYRYNTFLDDQALFYVFIEILLNEVAKHSR